MPYVAARVLPGAVLVAVAMVLFSAASVLAKDPDNPNGTHDGLFDNPGHHYGQLRHSPAPTPLPVPTPVPTPAPVTTSPTAAPHNAGRPSPASDPQPTSGITDLPVTLPAQPSGQVSVAAPRPADDGLWWLLLLILPLLLAIWVVVATRLAVTLARRLRAGKPAAHMAPARAAT